MQRLTTIAKVYDLAGGQYVLLKEDGEREDDPEKDEYRLLTAFTYESGLAIRITESFGKKEHRDAAFTSRSEEKAREAVEHFSKLETDKEK